MARAKTTAVRARTIAARAPIIARNCGWTTVPAPSKAVRLLLLRAKIGVRLRVASMIARRRAPHTAHPRASTAIAVRHSAASTPPHAPSKAAAKGVRKARRAAAKHRATTADLRARKARRNRKCISVARADFVLQLVPTMAPRGAIVVSCAGTNRLHPLAVLVQNLDRLRAQPDSHCPTGDVDITGHE